MATARDKKTPNTTDELPECCRKKLKGNEVYRYMNSNFVFDVELANRIVRDGREPVEVDRESTRTSVRMSDIRRHHLPHVDPTRPGIIAHVQVTTEEGAIVRGHLLIDGNHRAARCLQLKRPFFAYLLTEEESLRVLERGPHETFTNQVQMGLRSASGLSGSNPTDDSADSSKVS
jgi:hypothetical protein